MLCSEALINALLSFWLHLFLLGLTVFPLDSAVVPMTKVASPV